VTCFSRLDDNHLATLGTTLHWWYNLPEMIMEPEWSPAGVCIFGCSRSRSQYFRFEPEQEPESALRPA